MQLKTLSLANNEISAIENVQQLTTLEKLNLSRNRLASLEGLAVLSSLAEVDVSFNSLHRVQAQHLPPRLRALNVGSNCIQQLSHLESLAQASSLAVLRIAGSHLSCRVSLITATACCVCFMILVSQSTGNPCCATLDYVSAAAALLPQVEAIDDIACIALRARSSPLPDPASESAVLPSVGVITTSHSPPIPESTVVAALLQASGPRRLYFCPSSHSSEATSGRARCRRRSIPGESCQHARRHVA